MQAGAGGRFEGSQWVPPRRGIWLAVAMACAFYAAPAFAELPIGLTEDLSLTHDSEVRVYDVLRPVTAGGNQPRPLVVDLHGFTSDGNAQRGISGWDVLAQAQGFLVAWPDGLDNSWNGGTCCGTSMTNDVDDVGFIRAMVAAIEAQVNVDPERVYVTGLSNGGAMTQRLACEAADLFVAAAPMAYPVPYVDFAAECNASESIPVLSFMGLTDVLVPYAGAAPSFAAWRDENGCDSGGAAVEIAETYGGSDCAIDTSCGEADVEVGLCSVTGSVLPPPFDVFNGHILYINDDDFAVSERAWDFMSRYGASTAVPSVGPVGLVVTVGLLVAVASRLGR